MEEALKGTILNVIEPAVRHLLSVTLLFLLMKSGFKCSADTGEFVL